jgi:phospholipase C
MRLLTWRRALVTASLVALLGSVQFGQSGGGAAPKAEAATGLDKIDHMIFIVQENRSFSEYFGTYPGVQDPLVTSGPGTPCLPNPETGSCVKPYHEPKDDVLGAPHGHEPALQDINGGAMDGFVAQAAETRFGACLLPHDPACTRPTHGTDIMGHYDRRELQNYWRYADNFVLHDHMYESASSYTLPAHLFLVSAWSARCASPTDPMSCTSALEAPGAVPGVPNAKAFPWTDITQLLFNAGVSWRYYVAQGTQPDCDDAGDYCIPKPQKAGSSSIFNPLPEFNTVRDNGQLGNIQTADQFLEAARNGTLPAVSWVVPSGTNSEHPHATPSRGTGWVTSLVNAVMSGPDWDSSAVFVTWDDWGGFYDGSPPPTVDQNGYGIRLPSFMISPYAKQGYIDHQTHSFDSYLKLVEDRFLGGQRLDPATDGRPDSRPTVREAVPTLGDLTQNFDFNQSPRPPMLLPVYPFPAPGSTGG